MTPFHYCFSMGKPSAQKMFEISNANQTEEDSVIESDSDSETEPPMQLIEVPNTTTSFKRGTKRVKVLNSSGSVSKPSETRKRRQKTVLDINDSDQEKVYDVPKLETTSIQHRHTIG